MRNYGKKLLSCIACRKRMYKISINIYDVKNDSLRYTLSCLFFVETFCVAQLIENRIKTQVSPSSVYLKIVNAMIMSKYLVFVNFSQLKNVFLPETTVRVWEASTTATFFTLHSSGLLLVCADMCVL